MPSKAGKSLVVLFLAATTGCADAPPPTGNGRLDLTVVPDSLIASGRPLQGSFELQGLDRAARVRVPIEGAGYQTRSVALAPGVYNLRWHPGPQPSFPDELASRAPENPAMARSIVIASNRVTALTVHSTLNAPEVAQPVAAIGQPSEPNSRPAQP